MPRIRKYLSLMAALLVGVATLVVPAQARAAFAVLVYDDGVLQGGITTFVLGNSLVYFGTTTNFSIANGSGLSNNPGTQGGSNLALSNNAQVTTTFGSVGGVHTLRIELSQDFWTAPTGSPIKLSSSAGGSFDYQAGTSPGTQTVAAMYFGALDNTNTLFGQPVAGRTPVQSATASLTDIGTAPLVFSPNPSVNLLTPGGVPFSMTDCLEYTFTLDPGSGQTTANVSASTNASALPAPAGLILVLSGLPVFGIGAWRRRRQTKLTTL